ncbi:hypothetical protein [Desulfonatronovibrio hydrogenovorans]|uniref:hypothetical protein n=1 Tax=Desulfonatronovibrio hydrogenovorans TaxID=53245 RepID=UPI000491BA16|nr:hypothetical protein [Desulfonatronovibrio hydrogenovorans]
MDGRSEIGIAVSTDELVLFLEKCSYEARTLIREMSIGAVRRFRLSSSTKGEMTILYLNAWWNEDLNPGVAEIMIWIRALADRDKMVYYLRIGSDEKDQDEVKTDKFGAFGIRTRKKIISQIRPGSIPDRPAA